MGDETGSPAPPRPRQGRAGRRPSDVATCTAASIGIATDSPASRLPEDCCVGLNGEGAAGRSDLRPAPARSGAVSTRKRKQRTQPASRVTPLGTERPRSRGRAPQSRHSRP